MSELLNKAANKIVTGRELTGSKYQDATVENIATQVIVRCRLNFYKHGEDFTWFRNDVGAVCGNGVVDNPLGLSKLVDDGSIVVEEYKGKLKAPSLTVKKNGKPLVLRATDKLLKYADRFIK